MKKSILYFQNVSKKYYRNNFEINTLESINFEIPISPDGQESVDRHPLSLREIHKEISIEKQGNGFYQTTKITDVEESK